MPAPTLTDVAPNTGPLTGGTEVVLTGTDFVAPTQVQFAAANATNVVILGPDTLTAVTPAGTVGVVNVTVTNVDGTATLTGGFTYEAAGLPPRDPTEAYFPAFVPIVPPPLFGLPPPPVFPPVPPAHTPVPVPVGPLVGPVVKSAAVPPSFAGITQPVIGGNHPSVFPGFTTTFPNPPVSVQTTPPPPAMIPTTPPVPPPTVLTERHDNASALHHGNAGVPERRAGPVLSAANPDQLHQSSAPKSGRFKRMPPGRSHRDHD